MNNVQFKYSNLSRIKEIIKKYVVKREESKKFKGRPSFDKPWEKGMLFTPKKINIPNIPYAAFAISNRPKLYACKKVLSCHEASIGVDEFQIQSYRLAKALKAKGIKKGDNVCLSMNESIQATIVEAACSYIGAVSVSLPANASVEGLKEYLKFFNCKYYFISDQYRTGAEEAMRGFPNLEACVVSTDLSFRGMTNLSDFTKEWLKKCENKNELLDNENSFEDMLELGKVTKYDRVIEELNPDDPAKISFTSGTSGKPKPIYLSNGNLLAQLIRQKYQTHMDIGPLGVSLKVVADMYPYGNFISKWCPIYFGKEVGLTPALTPYNPDFYLYLYEPLYIMGIPELYDSMLENENIKKNGLKFIFQAITGGAKVLSERKKQYNEFFASTGCKTRIKDGCGVGELVASTTSPIGAKYNIDSVGRPIVGVNVRIIEDIDGKPYNERKELIYGEEGLICYSGETLMLGYYNMPEKTAESIFYDEFGQRWFVSDAIGHIDRKGYLYVSRRKARCFIAFDEETGSTYKLSPEDVEEALQSLDIAKDSIAVSMPISSNGVINKVVKLYVKKQNDELLTEEEKELILNTCKNSSLAKCSIPRKIVQWFGEFPKINGENSKIDYKEIQRRSDEEEMQMINMDSERNLTL